jgi:hypothetical protein
MTSAASFASAAPRARKAKSESAGRSAAVGWKFISPILMREPEASGNNPHLNLGCASFSPLWLAMSQRAR